MTAKPYTERVGATVPAPLRGTDPQLTSTFLAAHDPDDRRCAQWGPSYFTSEYDMQEWLRVRARPNVTVFDLDRGTGEWVAR